MEFDAVVAQTGKNTTGIEVPADIVTQLGGGKRPKVRAVVADYAYRSSIASMNGVFLLSVSAEVRERAGVAAGDHVRVRVELDTEERTVEVPADLADALAARPAAHARFAALSYSERRRLVGAVEGAKAVETRQRRITRTVDSLADEGV